MDVGLSIGEAGVGKGAKDLPVDALETRIDDPGEPHVVFLTATVHGLADTTASGG